MEERNLSIFNFKEFLTRILLPLVLILCVAGLVFNYFFEKEIILKSEVCGAYKVNRIITKTDPQEVPIFGSSRAAYGLIPDSLGSYLFNYGLAGTNYDVTLFFLEEEMKKAKTTPYVLLNFDLDGMTSSRGDIGNYILNASDTAVKSLLGPDDRYYFRIPFLKYYGRFESYFRLFLSNRIALTKFTNKGASLEKSVLPQQEFNELVTEREHTRTIFRNDPALEQRLMALLQAHPERRFIFVIAPYHPSYFVGYTNLGQAEAFLDSLRGMGNVRVLDFSRMVLGDSMFLNTTHINYKGAVVFNRALRDSLAKLKVKGKK